MRRRRSDDLNIYRGAFTNTVSVSVIQARKSPGECAAVQRDELRATQLCEEATKKYRETANKHRVTCWNHPCVTRGANLRSPIFFRSPTSSKASTVGFIR